MHSRGGNVRTRQESVINSGDRLNKMSTRDTSPEERQRGAAVLAKLLYQSVTSRCRGKWRDDFNPHAIDEDRSDSIIEFRRREWPPRYRLSIHSDKRCSLVGYGVFRPSNMKQRSNDEGLPECLAAHVPSGRTRPEHWAWYREMEEPLRDFSRQETLIEVEKIRQGKTSTGDAAFRQASDDLVKLAKALDGWYSQFGPTPR